MLTNIRIRQINGGLGHTQIPNHHTTITVEEHVGWFQVTGGDMDMDKDMDMER